MSVVSRLRLPGWARVVKASTPAPCKLRFSTVASVHSALNSTKASTQQHLELLIADNLWKSSSTSQILKELADLRSTSLTQRVIAQYIDSKNITHDEFVKALQCYGLSEDAESALSFYTTAIQTRPELQSIYSLQALLSISRTNHSISAQVLDLYFSALKNAEHFPTLRTDLHAAATVVSIIASIKDKLPKQLNEGLALKEILIAEGVKIDANLYGQLILACSTHNNYAFALEVYAEAKSVHSEFHIALETAILRAALNTDNITDCFEIFERITASGAPLTDKVVLTMLKVANKVQSKELTLQIAQQWRKSGGELSWAMCEEILRYTLDDAMLFSLSRGASKPSQKPFFASPPKDMIVLPPEEYAAQNLVKTKFHSDLRQLVRSIVIQVRQNLFAVMSRTLSEKRSGIVPDFSLRLHNDNLTSAVPINVLSRVAALVADDVHIGLELVLQRVELGTSTFPTVEARKQAHVQVVHTLARDLAVLNRWRELLSLSHRLDGYRSTADPLQYSPAELVKVETYSALALLRDNKSDRAAHVISTRLAARLDEVSKDDLPEALVGVHSALRVVDTEPVVAAETAQVLRYCVPVVAPHVAQLLFTEALLSAALPSEVFVLLQALVGANSTTEAVHDFKLEDHHVAVIERVLSGPLSITQRKWVRPIREAMASLTTPIAGV